jgi:signal transduction histidine kinase
MLRSASNRRQGDVSSTATVTIAALALVITIAAAASGIAAGGTLRGAVPRPVAASAPEAARDLIADDPARLRRDLHDGLGPQLVITPDTLPPLPAAVEVALYRIAAEALANAENHSDAATCTVRLMLDQTAETVRLDIIDDGKGIGTNRGTGVGLSSMRERAAELGGTLTVTAGLPGGTVVTAVLPCPTSDDPHRRQG